MFLMTEKQIQTAFESKSNLFITGPAGVGKSYRINDFISRHPELNILMCAPTGIAAMNIGGDTAHRVFHIPVPAYQPPTFAKGRKGAVTESMLKVIAQADVIFLDEVSMMRNDNFSFMIKVIRRAEKLKGSKIRLIVSGDFSQLPPVVKKTELGILKKFGFDTSGYPFTTSEWRSCRFKVVELTQVMRQDDAEFIENLNKIRVGDCSDLSYWDRFVCENPDYGSAIVVCGTNAEADRINRDYLDSLPGDLKVLQSHKLGFCSAGYVDDIILVKEGCRVIFTVNDNIGKAYHNGTFGIVKSVGSENVVVTVNDKDIVVKQHDFTIYSYNLKGGSLVKTEAAVIRQFPFKLGKAITIHKSQGQTFDRMVLSPEIFAPGQLYVALSRVRNPEGLVLLKPLCAEYLIVDDTVKRFYENGYTWEAAKRTASTKKSVSACKKNAVKCSKSAVAKSCKQQNRQRKSTESTVLTKRLTVGTKKPAIKRAKSSKK